MLLVRYACQIQNDLTHHIWCLGIDTNPVLEGDEHLEVPLVDEYNWGPPDPKEEPEDGVSIPRAWVITCFGALSVICGEMRVFIDNMNTLITLHFEISIDLCTITIGFIFYWYLIYLILLPPFPICFRT